MSRNWSAFLRGYSPDVGTKIFLFTSGVLTDGNLGNIWKSEITNDMFSLCLLPQVRGDWALCKCEASAGAHSLYDLDHNNKYIYRSMFATSYSS